MTPSEVRGKFNSRGETIRSWALRHHIDVGCAYRLLNGRSVGIRGKTHEVAVALGLKPNPETGVTEILP
ncbi:MAG: DNA-binding protein [Zoogloeaceae bacterium]|jgi:gp16 family phage-associated protein|nr:DNA-binding protein [Zoogloeaceae bacterium]